MYYCAFTRRTEISYIKKWTNCFTVVPLSNLQSSCLDYLIWIEV